MKTNANILTKNTLTKSLIILGLVVGVSLPAAANKYRDYNNSAYDYARVINVTPIVESYQVNNPVKECWDEQVRYEPRHNNSDRYDQPKSHTADILGAIIGGAIGNRFGHGDGRKIATVAGAVLGRSVGRDISRNNKRHYNDAGHRYETVQQCELRDSYSTKEHVVGYDVSYKYNGNVYQTQLDNHPGNEIKVKVTVNPV